MSAVQPRRWRTAVDGPVVVCIARDPADRARLAGSFEGAGVLVITTDPLSAAEVLESLPGTPRATRPGDQVRLGELVIDLGRFETYWRNRPLRLTPHELGVLACLARRPGQLWTFAQLHDQAWDGSYFTGPSAVQSVVKRLRAKLRAAGVTHTLTSARGLGFRLDVNDSPGDVKRSP